MTPLLKYRNLSIFFLLMWTLYACDYSYFEYPESSSAFILKRAVLTNKSARQISFYVDVHILNRIESGVINERTNVPDSCFRLLNYNNGGASFTYQITSIEKKKDPASDSFETLLLIDNSYYDRDHDKIVTESINGFVRSLKPESRYCLSYFARDGKLKNNIFEVDPDSIRSGWSQDAITRMFKKSVQTSGTSSFYDAAYRAIDFLDSFGTYSNKSITMFLVNKDDGNSQYTLDEVILHAVKKKIRVNIFWLLANDNIDWYSMYRLPSETGGLGTSGYEWELATTFLAFSRLLREDYQYYRINAKVNLNSPYSFSLPYYGEVVFNQTGYLFDNEYFRFSLNQ